MCEKAWRLPRETVMRTQAGRRQTLEPRQTLTGTTQMLLWTNVNFLCGWMQPWGSQFESFDTKPLNLVGSSCCSVAQSCPTLCDPMDCSTPGFHVLYHLLALTQTLVYRVSDAIQPSHPLSSPSPPAFIFPSVRVFSKKSVLHIRWPKYWNFSFRISLFKEFSE